MKRFIPSFIISLYHACVALAAALWYRFPSRNIVVIGVTGTNGKSTVVHLTHAIFVEAGYKVASCSSLRFIINGKEETNKTKMTMPGRFFMQKFLRQAVDEKCDIAIIEVTSEGIKQSRHQHIDFDVAALTNVTSEHIESHGSFEKYRATKIKLFQALARSPKRGKGIVVNADDSSAKLFLTDRRSETWLYGLHKTDLTAFGRFVTPAQHSISDKGLHFIYEGVDYTLQLEGEFNMYNALCALAIGLSRGIDPHIVRTAFEKISGVPGRLEHVLEPPRAAFTVIVDYAHTPDALVQVYKTVKKPPHKLICVLGSAGGGRDKWKRPEMGRIADEYCDEIILTNEDPYDEDPEQILEDIKKGMQKKTPTIILDRKDAIVAAIKKSGADDVVIITGKGAEPWLMGPGGIKTPWDDREVVRKAVQG